MRRSTRLSRRTIAKMRNRAVARVDRVNAALFTRTAATPARRPSIPMST